MNKLAGIILMICMIAACNNVVKNDHKMSEKEVKKDSVTEHTINPGLLVNKKDPVCEMPISAGISDSVTYKGNLLGFCSPECKAEFMKKPEDYIAKADLKIK